ncbi:MAG: hypothetical protein K2X70_13945 [Candidatus Obscuribacterales bacterium]|nr:hypothetical protein [Candidatus Obscuribacterales bacterium]
MTTTMMTPTISDFADATPLIEAAFAGAHLSGKSAGLIFAALSKNPLDLYNRARLLGYCHYQSRAFPQNATSELKGVQIEQVLWFIHNAPSCIFARTYFMGVSPNDSADACQQIGKAWQQALVDHPLDIFVAVNAAMFFVSFDERQCRICLEHIAKLDPSNPWIQAFEQHLSDEICAPRVVPISDFDLKAALQNKYATYRLDASQHVVLHPKAATYARIFADDPEDLTARWHLWRHAALLCQPLHILGFDPLAEKQYIEHASWFIKKALRECIDDKWFVPILSLQARRHLVALIDSHSEMTTAKRTKKMQVLIDKLRFLYSDAYAAILLHPDLSGLESSPYVASVPTDHLRLPAEPMPQDLQVTEYAELCDMQFTRLQSQKHISFERMIKLDTAISGDSCDVESRAMIVSLAHSPLYRDVQARDQVVTIVSRHLSWIIQNAPACVYLRDFDWEMLPGKILRAAIGSWSTVIEASNDANALTNAALAYLLFDKLQASRAARRALEINGDHATAKEILRRIDGLPSRFSAVKELKDSGFIPGLILDEYRDVGRMSRISETNLHFSARSAWTLQCILAMEPTAVEHHVEMIRYFWTWWSNPTLGRKDPSSSKALVGHALKAMQYAPFDIDPRTVDKRDPQGVRVIGRAVLQQCAAYPDDVQVISGLHWYFLLANYRTAEGLKILENLVRAKPRDRRAKEMLKAFVDISL